MSLQQSTDKNISITDTIETTADDLFCYHYNKDVSVLSSSETKQCRGIIKTSKQKVVCRSFGYTPEFTLSDVENISNHVLPLLDNPNLLVFPSQEGTMIRVFHYSDEWYFSTHKKINSFESRWGCDKSFGDLFVEAYKKKYEVELKSIYEDLDERFNKENMYVFLLKNCMLNRIVCSAPEYPEVELICHLQMTPGVVETTHCHFYNETESLTTLFTKDNLSDLVSDIDITKYQGYLFIDSQTLECVKVLNNKYTELSKLRNNQPSLLFRHIELQQENMVSELLDELQRFEELYPEHQDSFNRLYKVLEDVCDNIYKKYRNRFVRKQISFAPPDQFYIMKSLHDNFIASGKTDFITRQKVIDHVYKLHPTKIINLFNSYNNREKLYGDGNRISQEDKDKIVSCIYKDTPPTTTVNQVN